LKFQGIFCCINLTAKKYTAATDVKILLLMFLEKNVILI